jgi:Tfp pilus assembly protein PilN
MIDLNFLPKIQKKDIQWLTVLFSILLLVSFIHLTCRNTYAETKKQMAILSEEIRVMDKALLEKPSAEPSTVSNHSRILSILRFLQEVPSSLPVGLYLTSLTQMQTHLLLVGCAETVEQVAQWLAVLKKIHFPAALQSLQFDEKNSDFPVNFHLEVML